MLNNRAKEVILQATLDAIAENSISNTSMQVIAKRAGMRQPNLHYYFKTKKELLMQLMDWMQSHYDELIDKQLEGKDHLDTKLSGFFEQERFCMENEPSFTRVSLDLWGLGQSDPEIRDHYASGYAIWRGRIASAIAQYMPEISVNKCNLAASLVISILMGASLQYMSDPQVFDLDQYMQCGLESILLLLRQPESSAPAVNEK